MKYYKLSKLSDIVDKKLLKWHRSFTQNYLVGKITCFHDQNNLFSKAKQLVFESKISYLQKQNKLFPKAK